MNKPIKQYIDQLGDRISTYLKDEDLYGLEQRLHAQILEKIRHELWEQVWMKVGNHLYSGLYD